MYFPVDDSGVSYFVPSGEVANVNISSEQTQTADGVVPIFVATLSTGDGQASTFRFAKPPLDIPISPNAQLNTEYTGEATELRSGALITSSYGSLVRTLEITVPLMMEGEVGSFLAKVEKYPRLPVMLIFSDGEMDVGAFPAIYIGHLDKDMSFSRIGEGMYTVNLSIRELK